LFSAAALRTGSLADVTRSSAALSLKHVWRRPVDNEDDGRLLLLLLLWFSPISCEHNQVVE